LRGSGTSTRFAAIVGMRLLSRSAHRVADIVGRLFGRLAAVIIGFIMMVVGLGMTASIVMLPVGVVLLLLGVLIFVGGIFVPDDRSERLGGR
jgi:hypothetical protein